jgi:hypothetical protein
MMKSKGPVFELGARVVLNDCRFALLELKRNPAGEHWRILLVASCTLLRTVAEALFKVDMDNPLHPPELRKAVKDFYDELGTSNPKPQIYWEFIREHANKILHEYDLRATQGITARPTGENHPITGAKKMEITGRSYTIRTGPYQGKDPRDVIEEAIDWWDDQLSDIECKAASKYL